LGSLFTIAFVVGIIILTLILLCIPAGLSILVYKLVRKKFNKYVALALASIIPLLCIYEIYDAIWPGDGFYMGEFETVTGIKMPDSGKIIRKDAMFPAIGGDYYSSAFIEFSNRDYIDLLAYIKSDTSFKDSTIIGSDSFGKALGPSKDSEIIFRASYYDKEDYKFIGFLSDGKSVIIHFINE
jgi:hypothetical protein